MAKIRVTNKNFATKLNTISAGDEIILISKNYHEPLILQGITGTKERPIIVRPNFSKKASQPTITSNISDANARKWANEEANRRQKSGYYPSFGHLGDQSMMVLRNCQYVIIHGLEFQNCWPGAIYIDKSQYITVDNITFLGGTIAIGANGIDTHDIIVQECKWQQDTSKNNDLWNKIPWSRIHGAHNNSALKSVDIERDYRHFDGDFFRSWNIGSNIIIRNNLIQDAFNAIHCFNTFDRLAPGVDADGLIINGGRASTSNILIENNTFLRIRDNAIEPEYHAWNWVIRGNHMHDCYRPFSFEFARAGYFYIYNNTASFVNKPSTDMSDYDKQKIPQKEWRMNPSLFKPKGEQKNEGQIYIFNNSWYMKVGKGILPKFGLGQLVCVNNAMQFDNAKKARMFGGRGDNPSHTPYSLEHELRDETGRFTRRWGDYNITMNADIGNDINFPEIYQQLGYNIGNDSVNAYPDFSKPDEPSFENIDFTMQADQKKQKAIQLSISLPDGNRSTIKGGHYRGAAQEEGTYKSIDRIFKFLPDTSWLPDLKFYKKNKQEPLV